MAGDQITHSSLTASNSGTKTATSAVAYQSNQIHNLIQSEFINGSIENTFFTFQIKQNGETGHLKITHSGRVVLPEKFTHLATQDSDCGVSVQSIKDIKKNLLTKTENWTVPIENSDTDYARVEVIPKLLVKLDAEELIEPIYYTETIDRPQLDELETTLSTQETIPLKFITDEKIQLLPNKKHLQHLDRLYTAMDGNDTRRKIVATTIVSVPLILIQAATVSLYGLEFIAKNPYIIAELTFVLSTLLTILLLVGVFEIDRSGKKRDFTTQSEMKPEDTATPASTVVGSPTKTTNESRTVHIKSDEQSIAIIDVESDSSWTLPTTTKNSVLTSSSVQFLQTVGFEKIDSDTTTTIHYSQSRPTNSTSVVEVKNGYLYTTK